MNGKFVISLDFELHWGMFDKKSVGDYRENLDNTREAIKKIVNLSNEHEVRLTFATVGFLFAKNKEDLEFFSPTLHPSYADQNLDPYPLIKNIGDNESEDPYHYARNTIEELVLDNRHEIGTHTFSHYYCNAKNQNKEEFEADLIAAKNIAKKLKISINSIVFPRNQIQTEYLSICAEHGISSFRGNEYAFAFRTQPFVPERLRKALRFIDSYINIFGHGTYNILKLKEVSNPCLDLPSSRFLRPFSKRFKKLEVYKVQRIKKAMTYAAKRGHLYHLWWHPHNFGTNMKENMNNLEQIYVHYQKLRHEFDFQSETMTSLTNKFLN